MNYGFVKVAAAVPHVKVADCKFNVERIESQIAIAEGKGVQIIVFPEMSITGYTCGDLFGQQILLEEAEMGLMQILNNTRQLDIISIVGMPVVVNSTVINTAAMICFCSDLTVSHGIAVITLTSEQRANSTTGSKFHRLYSWYSINDLGNAAFNTPKHGFSQTGRQTGNGALDNAAYTVTLGFCIRDYCLHLFADFPGQNGKIRVDGI